MGFKKLSVGSVALPVTLLHCSSGLSLPLPLSPLCAVPRSIVFGPLLPCELAVDSSVWSLSLSYCGLTLQTLNHLA